MFELLQNALMLYGRKIRKYTFPLLAFSSSCTMIKHILNLFQCSKYIPASR